MTRYIPIPIQMVNRLQERGVEVEKFSFNIYASQARSEYSSDDDEMDINYDWDVPEYIKDFIRSRVKINYYRFPDFEEVEPNEDTEFVKFLDVEVEQGDTFDYDATYVSVKGDIYCIS